jgi:hypothetical protein
MSQAEYFIINKETPCRAILNKQENLLSRMENLKVKQVLSGGWYQWEGTGCKERVKEAECNRNIMCNA